MRTDVSNIFYNQIFERILYLVLMPEAVYNQVEMPEDRQVIQEIFKGFDSPLPIENVNHLRNYSYE